MKRPLMLLTVLVLFSIALPAQTASAKSGKAPAAAKAKPSAASGAIKPWNQLKAPPLPPFKPQQPKRVQLSNGMVIFLQEDHELPLISGEVRIRGGARDVPTAKTGLD